MSPDGAAASPDWSAVSPDYAVVIPTLGRPSLARLLASLTAAGCAARVLVVDDRRPGGAPLACGAGVTVVTSGGCGPAAARNRGWQAHDTTWVAFLDDDVVVGESWCRDLLADLETADACRAAASQGRVRVPPPRGRATDAERGTAGLETARWITADMAVRRSALSAVGGFDERFPRAFREDADLGLRLSAAGESLLPGRREVVHPVRPAPWHASIGAQRGNRDDALMRRLHGRSWHRAAGADVGRRPRHLGIVAGAAVAAAAALAGRRRTAAVATLAWALGSAEFGWARIAPGPRGRDEVARMLATSVVIPFAATWHWLAGSLRHRSVRPWDSVRPLDALLVDRDGTIVEDVPYNTDPALVRPVAAAAASLDRVRAAGLPVALITNQSGVGRGLITEEQLAAVHRRVDELLGPFDDWQVCPHVESDHCECRKPAPGMILAAAEKLGVPPHRLLVVGDIGSDMSAARAAGALGVLVPTAVTRPAETAAARHVRPTLPATVDFLLDLHRRRDADRS